MPTYPSFDSVPKTAGQPQGNAWALWGENDELGTLNYLTPEVILQATKEIKAGVTIQLDLPLNHFDHLGAGRQGFSHQIIDFKERLKGTDLEIVAHDDVLTMNTQSSSQWDGLRHIGLQESGIYYGGVKHRDIDEKREDGRLGIQKWVQRGGIVGRGVLLDYHGWRQQTGQAPVTIPSNTIITTEELEAVIKHQTHSCTTETSSSFAQGSQSGICRQLKRSRRKLQQEVHLLVLRRRKRVSGGSGTTISPQWQPIH
ncbi:hypothetical protein CLAIMM_13816 [Cladophialophora immunda]|nr:hypothetical protein CLAIMM_13816 [Cladophialophora immunda]